MVIDDDERLLKRKLATTLSGHAGRRDDRRGAGYLLVLDRSKYSCFSLKTAARLFQTSVVLVRVHIETVLTILRFREGA